MRILSAAEISAFLHGGGSNRVRFAPITGRTLAGYEDWYNPTTGRPVGYVGGPGNYDESQIFGGAGLADALAADQAALDAAAAQGATGNSPVPAPAPPPFQQTPGGPTRVTIATTPFTGRAQSLAVLTQNIRRALLIVQNLDTTQTLYVGFGTAATSSSSLALLPQVGVMFDTSVPVDSISIIFSTGAASLGVALEGVPFTG